MPIFSFPAHIVQRALLALVALLVMSPAQQLVGQSISLDQALEQARENGSAVRIAQARLNAADTRALVASQWWLPEVSLGAGYHALSGAAMAIAGDLITDVSQRNINLAAGLSASWAPGPAMGAYAAASLDAQATSHDLASVNSAAQLATAWAYYDLLEAEQTEQALARWGLSNDTWASELRALVDAGLTPEFTALLVESAGLTLTAEQAVASAARSAAAARLEVQMGTPPQTTSDSSSGQLRCAETEMLFVAIQTADNLPHPETLAAQARLEAAQQRHSTALSEPFLPSVSIGASGGVFGNDLPDLYGRRGANASLSWRIPLDRIFGAGGESKLRQSEASIAEQEVAAVTQRQGVQRTNASHGLAAEIARYEAARSAERVAALALEQSTQRLALDVAEPQEIFIVREAAIEAELDRIRAAAACHRAQWWLRYLQGAL